MNTDQLMRWPRMLIVALVLALLPALAGCDLFDGGRTWEGVVVDADTGAPIEGIHVSLKLGGGGFGGGRIIEATFTGRSGEFRLRTERRDTNLYVNAPGYGGDDVYRPDYFGTGPMLYKGEPVTVRLEPRVP